MSVPSRQVNKDSAIFVDNRLGGIARYYFGYPDELNMEIPPEIQKCVVFLCYEQSGVNGTKDFIPFGTAFFIEVKEENLTHFYLITAKHNLDEIKKIGVDKIFIRINSKNGGANFIEVAERVKWYFHPDNDNNPVDVAITQIEISNLFDIRTIPHGMFLKEENIKNRDVDIGNEVFITGLFSRYYGKDKNLPIIRVGNIAMLPEEKIWVSLNDGCYIDAYLIEARSIGGLSGSPVFFREPYFKRLDNGQIELRPEPKYYLGGIIHGHWPIDDSKIDNSVDYRKEKNVNMGIAIITPAIKILEILNQKELKDMRMRAERNYKNENAPKTD